MVLAYKIISGYTIQKQFECGQFDILQESDPGNGWVEISRDCDAWLPARWSLYPYASGNNGGYFSSSNGTVVPEFAKYFEILDDTQLTELDLSDINSGVLPSNPSARMGIFQNGKNYHLWHTLWTMIFQKFLLQRIGRYRARLMRLFTVRLNLYHKIICNKNKKIDNFAGEKGKNR